MIDEFTCILLQSPVSHKVTFGRCQSVYMNCLLCMIFNDQKGTNKAESTSLQNMTRPFLHAILNKLHGIIIIYIDDFSFARFKLFHTNVKDQFCKVFKVNQFKKSIILGQDEYINANPTGNSPEC